MQSSMQKSGFSANELLRCLGILSGTLLYALGMNLFVVPAGLYTGGIMGLSQLLREDRIPQAIVLEGEAGCGKRTLARLIAAALSSVKFPS